MRDLAAVDRQLTELGPALERRQVAALLDRLLGGDRSLERLNELLDGLGGSTPLPARPAPLRDPLGGPGPRAPSDRPRSDPPAGRAPNPPGVRGSLPPRIVSPLAPVQGDNLKTATPWPPVASTVRSSRDTLVDVAQPAAPVIPKVDEQELDAETAALFGVTMPPVASPEPAASAPIEPAARVPMTPAEAAALSSSPPPVISSLPPPAAVPSPAPAAEQSDRGSGRAARNTLQWAAGVDSSPPAEPLAANSPVPAASAAAPASEPPSRLSTRQLLDQELDPSEFPSSHPPPRARSLPPPLPGGQSQRPTAEAQDGFEMLIDDSEEDIMEIDDVELEEIE